MSYSYRKEKVREKREEEKEPEFKTETRKERERRRQGFTPLVKGLDEKIEGGVPQGSWLSIYGPAGSLKTLHSLAFFIAGINKGEKGIYVSTEMYYEQIMSQLKSLGWDEYLKDVYISRFDDKILDDKDFGSYEGVIIDIDSLRQWAYKLNIITREEGEKKKRKIYWYHDENLLIHAIITALSATGVVERERKDISLTEIEYACLRDYLFKPEKYLYFTLNRDVDARVIIDSFSIYIERVGYNRAGPLSTWLKMRLAAPNITYVLVNHVSKTTEEELGAAIAHVVDGRVKLYPVEENGEQRIKGMVTKMRETNHSRKVHDVSIVRDKDKAVIEWM